MRLKRVFAGALAVSAGEPTPTTACAATTSIDPTSALACWKANPTLWATGVKLDMRPTGTPSATTHCNTTVQGKLQLRYEDSTCSEASFTTYLIDSFLVDDFGRIGSIVDNHQFQYDGPPQQGSIYTSGWSICDGRLYLGGNDTFYACTSGDFTNSYDWPTVQQCGPIKLLQCDLQVNETSAQPTPAASVLSSTTSESTLTPAGALSSATSRSASTSAGVPSLSTSSLAFATESTSATSSASATPVLPDGHYKVQITNTIFARTADSVTTSTPAGVTQIAAELDAPTSTFDEDGGYAADILKETATYTSISDGVLITEVTTREPLHARYVSMHTITYTTIIDGVATIKTKTRPAKIGRVPEPTPELFVDSDLFPRDGAFLTTTFRDFTGVVPAITELDNGVWKTNPAFTLHYPGITMTVGLGPQKRDLVESMSISAQVSEDSTTGRESGSSEETRSGEMDMSDDVDAATITDNFGQSAHPGSNVPPATFSLPDSTTLSVGTVEHIVTTQMPSTSPSPVTTPAPDSVTTLVGIIGATTVTWVPSAALNPDALSALFYGRITTNTVLYGMSGTLTMYLATGPAGVLGTSPVDTSTTLVGLIQKGQTTFLPTSNVGADTLSSLATATGPVTIPVPGAPGITFTFFMTTSTTQVFERLTVAQTITATMSQAGEFSAGPWTTLLSTPTWLTILPNTPTASAASSVSPVSSVSLASSSTSPASSVSLTSVVASSTTPAPSPTTSVSAATSSAHAARTSTVSSGAEAFKVSVEPYLITTGLAMLAFLGLALLL